MTEGNRDHIYVPIATNCLVPGTDADDDDDGGGAITNLFLSDGGQHCQV